MVYLAGVIGFLSGFALGQMILAVLLKDRSSKELISDRSLRIYGILNWLIAILFTLAFVSVYKAWLGHE